MFSVKSLRKQATCVLRIKQRLEHILHPLERKVMYKIRNKKVILQNNLGQAKAERRRVR